MGWREASTGVRRSCRQLLQEPIMIRSRDKRINLSDSQMEQGHTWEMTGQMCETRAGRDSLKRSMQSAGCGTLGSNSSTCWYLDHCHQKQQSAFACGAHELPMDICSLLQGILGC